MAVEQVEELCRKNDLPVPEEKHHLVRLLVYEAREDPLDGYPYLDEEDEDDDILVHLLESASGDKMVKLEADLMTDAELNNCTLPELREQCRKCGLPYDGKRESLFSG